MSKTPVLVLVNTAVRNDPRLMPQCESLVQLGYDVQVIGIARDAEGGQPVQTTHNNIKILLVPMVASYKLIEIIKATIQLLRGQPGTITSPPASRMSNLISFIFFNLWLLRVGFRYPAAVIHCHDILPLPSAWILARLRRAKLIYDARESVPDLYIGVKKQLLSGLENFLLPRADVVITVGERLAQKLRERGAQRVVLIGNWKKLEQYEPDYEKIEETRRSLNIGTPNLVISYIGSLDPTREIKPLLEAVSQSPEVTLLIAGRGIIEDHVWQAAQRFPNIKMLGWIKLEDVPLYTHLADALYYCLNFDQTTQDQLNVNNNYYSTPNKLFEAFAAGKAIIARRGAGEIGEILEYIPAGILLDAVTAETLKQSFGILQNRETLKSLQAASFAAREAYSWDVAETRLKQIYADLSE